MSDINKKVLHNIVYTLSTTVLSLIFGVIVSSVLVARFLGPENYGWFSYAMSIAAIATAFSSLGVDTIAIKFSNRHLDSADAYYRFAHTLKFVAGVLSALVIAVLALTRIDISNSQRDVLLFLSFVPMARSWSTFQARLTSEMNAKENLLNNVIVSVTGTICRLSIIYFNLHWSLFALCVLIDLIVHAILVELSNAKYHGWAKRQWVFGSLPKSLFLKESGPLFISGLFNVLYLRIDQLILFQLTTPAVVANYAVAVKWTESWYFIPAAVVSSVIGKLFSADDLSIQRNRYRRIFNLIGTMSFMFVIFFICLGRLIITTLYGGDYIGAIMPLKILAFSGIIATLGSAWSTSVISLGQQRILPLLLGICTTGNVLLNIVLIPKYGANGAAFATVVANTLPLLIIGLRNNALRESTILMIKASTGIPGINDIIALLRQKYRKAHHENY